jgi:adenine-specific DNA-methyltransferase
VIRISNSQAFIASHSSRLEFSSLTKILNGNLLAEIDFIQAIVNLKLTQDNKKSMGQYLTPRPIAELMAGMFNKFSSEITLLDAGAGIGSLSAAFVANVCQKKQQTSNLHVVAYEIDPLLIGYLHQTFKLCERECQNYGIAFSYEIHETDFIEDVVSRLQHGSINRDNQTEFTHAILNPPYLKINAHSQVRKLLSSIDIETSNLYTAFMATTARLLKSGGEFVAITPRSFCSGLYFREFRKMFLDMLALQQIYLFESRQEAFSEDDVLQETVIIHSTKNKQKPEAIKIYTSFSIDDEFITSNSVPYTEVVRPKDPEQFIHILPDTLSQHIVQKIECFNCTLKDLGITVSTGRVVDFRAKAYLRQNLAKNTVPLIYPVNFADGYIKHPKITKKPQALVYTQETVSLLVPNEHYVLCKRFSSKEEKRRIVAVIYDSRKFDYAYVGFENHLNYFHQNGHGLDFILACGLAAYLNSTLVDSFFRLFNGHTQVNATDLRNLKYPTFEQLMSLGSQVNGRFLTQKEIDEIIETELMSMTNQPNDNPVVIKARINEALQILTNLGFPRAQLNERSALSLLALINLKPTDDWQSAASPLMGITPMMDFMAQHYGKTYKPNTRETVRRQTVHQFLDAGLIVVNPDNISRPINSPKTVYQIEESALELLRTYNTAEWEKSLRTYLASVETLKKRYAQERNMSRIPIEIDGEVKTLSPGGQNILIEKVIKEFAPRFTPGGKLIYVGDTDEKFAHFDESKLRDLGVTVDSHGKMPDVIIHFITNNWLVLIEAVTSHGPINPKRKQEIETLFRDARIPLVMVTTFLSRKAMVEYLPEIAWETDVWVAEDATHLIHFNGQHLLQLHENSFSD